MTKTGEECAFPFSLETPTFAPEFHYGLTKREYFAGLAMQGILASCNAEFCPSTERIAEMSVAQADELIAILDASKTSKCQWCSGTGTNSNRVTCGSCGGSGKGVAG